MLLLKRDTRDVEVRLISVPTGLLSPVPIEFFLLFTDEIRKPILSAGLVEGSRVPSSAD